MTYSTAHAFTLWNHTDVLTDTMATANWSLSNTTDMDANIKSGNTTLAEVPGYIRYPVSTVLCVLFLFGLWTNSLSLTVLFQQKRKTSTEIMFIGLTICDLFVLGFSLVWYVTSCFTEQTSVHLYRFYKILFSKGIIVYFIFKPCSGAHLACMSVERNFAVFKALQFRTIWTPFIGKAVICVSFVSCLALGITLLMIEFRTALLLLTLALAITGSVVVVCNIVTFVGLRRRRQISHELQVHHTNQLERERKQTITLMFISGQVYIFLQFCSI